MGVISQTNINVMGSHCGVSIGEDGPSQMALEDIAMFRSLPGCTVFYPSDAVACERAVELSANQRGICFVRVSRPATAVIYENNERFDIGKAKVVRKSDSDKVLVVAAGVTLYEALKAADVLASKGVNIRVIDPFTIKPIDIAAQPHLHTISTDQAMSFGGSAPSRKNHVGTHLGSHWRPRPGARAAAAASL